MSRIGLDELRQGFFEQTLETLGRRLGKTQIKPLRGDRLAEGRRTLGQILQRGLGLSQPAEDERLDQATARDSHTESDAGD